MVLSLQLSRGCLLRNTLQKIYRRRGLNNKSKDLAEKQITIGDVTVRSTKPKYQHLVPQNYVSYALDGTIQLPQTALHHIRWMLQKDLLKQDMFLLGAPGPLRRQLVMQFLEITERELEYVALSRDTTESDLKQRREILNKTAEYHNQSVVRAALHGRVLVLDGINHVERNVLPVLNNLMENREMHLESGKFLMAPERYDQLLKTHNQRQLDDWGILRVSENFRIVALGLPTQQYKGTPLDPPLRSRFQSRYFFHKTYQELYEELNQPKCTVPSARLKELITIASTLQKASEDHQLPDFPFHNLHLGVQMMKANHHLTVQNIIATLYPYECLLKPDQQKQVSDLLTSMGLTHIPRRKVQRISSHAYNDIVNVYLDEIKLCFMDPSGSTALLSGDFVDLPHQRQVLATLLQSYAVGDVCLLGERGVGKQTLIKQLLRLVHQSAEHMMLYEDMNSRDFVQQRITNSEGDTIWQDSPLVRAAKAGSVVILNGLHKLHNSTAFILQRLIHDRELQLCDGTTLLRQDRYQSLLQQGLTKSQLTKRGVFSIPNSFRIIASGDSPKPDCGRSIWLTSEILGLFLYQNLRPLELSEEQELLIKLCGRVEPEMQKLLSLAQLLRRSKDPLLAGMAESLSTRQLLKVGRRLAAYPNNSVEDVQEILKHMFLMKFMPSLSRLTLEQAMLQVGIKLKPNMNWSSDSKRKQVSVVKNELRIGETYMSLKEISVMEQSKVPSILFFETPQHVILMERLLQDYLIGEHLLLVGNQGVGKNKIIDRLLELMRQPREYLQLHRDTTVQSLTVQATICDGKIAYGDSPLVKAVKAGHVLVIDEADKAPVNVTCILRTLIESGEMMLSDGRRILPYGHGETIPNSIETHVDFRIIMLANRPGFPFLGNDLFATVSDVFSCHAIENPTPESEYYLLQRYGPNVPDKTLKMLVNAFGELRSLSDEGILNYPYSTREVVNIVKHLDRFPKDEMSELVGNVLDFDTYQPEILNKVTKVMTKHGLSINAYATNKLQSLREEVTLKLTIHRNSGLSVSGPKFGKLDPKNKPHVGGNMWAGGTGGRDTAGLGGKGGPFRLDKGHIVYQLSDEEKTNISEEINRASREMNRKAYEQKLHEIEMSPYNHQLYMQLSKRNHHQVQQLKAVLGTLETKSKERIWQKYQSHGELDECRLIEGITGEKNIYKRRAETFQCVNNVPEKPNRLKLVVDVSGSMYRFNGYDGRLDRQLEAVVMVMEAFEGYEKHISYDIVGHSGEGWKFPFVNVGSAPKNDKERFEVIRMMRAHSQFCRAGDSTVKATREACAELGADLDCDNGIVLVLSDANLARYSISPRDLAIALRVSEPKVKGHVIFIASLAEEADQIKLQMMPGQSFVCMDLTKLPQTLHHIFASSLLKSV